MLVSPIQDEVFTFCEGEVTFLHLYHLLHLVLEVTLHCLSHFFHLFLLKLLKCCIFLIYTWVVIVDCKLEAISFNIWQAIYRDSIYLMGP